MKPIRPLPQLVLAAVLIGLVSFVLMASGLGKDWQDRFQTVHYLFESFFQQPQAAKLPLVIVLINDRSLPDKAQRSPIDRNWLAKLIDGISSQNPAIIGLNILFDKQTTAANDQRLADSIHRSGKVIIRSDPVYPPISPINDQAMDSGTLKFRADSAGTIQAVCNQAETCGSENSLPRVILKHYLAGHPDLSLAPIPKTAWLKIHYAGGAAPSSGFKAASYSLVYADEIDRLPAHSLTGKIVLIGGGFEDLYPLYRTPFQLDGQFLQETELLAQTLTMMSNGAYLLPISPVLVALILLLTMISAALLFKFRGIETGIGFIFLGILIFFIGSVWAFSRANLEIPFLVPAISLLIYGIAGIAVVSVSEAFSRLEIEVQLKQAKIDLLTNELHSHHLFNEFSRLSVMIRQDPPAAREYLIEFAEMLRSSLKFSDQVFVPVSRELEYIQSYLNQQRLIHRNKIQFLFDFNARWEQYQIPWHCLFPLVENAVKYAESWMVNNPENTASIRIDIQPRKRDLVFSVENPFDPTSKPPSTQTGLNNLEERLSLFFSNNSYSLSHRKIEGKWIAELQLPLKPV